MIDIKDNDHKNLNGKVYQNLKDAIIKGELKAGEKLKEIKLASLFNTSRTPVREALRRLEKDGLVVFFPSQGAEVTNLSTEALTNFYECRSVLEGLAARKAAIVVHTQQLEQMEESIFLAERYLKQGEPTKVIEKNTFFHEMIINSANSPPLIHLMNQVRSQILRYRIVTGSIGFRPSFLEEHRQIFLSLKNKNADKAEELMRFHILADLNRMLKLSKDYQNFKEEDE